MTQPPQPPPEPDQPPPPPPAYGPPGPGPYAGPPPAPGPYGQPPGPGYGVSDADARQWGMLAHLLALVTAFVTGFLGWIAPLIVMQTKGRESDFVRDQAVESLNFQITLLIVVIVSIPLLLIVVGIFTLIAAAICGLVFPILGTIAANRGERYRYPINWRIVR